MSKRDRNHALGGVALIAIGALATLDNVVAHWILGLHRAVPGPWAGPVEIALVVLAIGVWRERQARH